MQKLGQSTTLFINASAHFFAIAGRLMVPHSYGDFLIINSDTGTIERQWTDVNANIFRFPVMGNSFVAQTGKYIEAFEYAPE